MNEDLIRAVLLAAEVAAKAVASYNQFREIAKSAGVTDEQLAEADGRFLNIRPDPLGIVQ